MFVHNLSIPLPPFQRCTFCDYVMFDVSAGRSNKGKEFIMMFMTNNDSPDNNIELMITSTSNTAANVNVTLPLHDPGFLQTLVVQRGQPMMVRVFVFVIGTNTPPTQPRFSSDSRTNKNNIFYSSQREIKAVVRSYTLTHIEELNCTRLTNSKS